MNKFLDVVAFLIVGALILVIFTAFGYAFWLSPKSGLAGLVLLMVPLVGWAISRVIDRLV